MLGAWCSVLRARAWLVLGAACPGVLVLGAACPGVLVLGAACAGVLVLGAACPGVLVLGLRAFVLGTGVLALSRQHMKAPSTHLKDRART